MHSSISYHLSCYSTGNVFLHKSLNWLIKDNGAANESHHRSIDLDPPGWMNSWQMPLDQLPNRLPGHPYNQLSEAKSYCLPTIHNTSGPGNTRPIQIHPAAGTSPVAYRPWLHIVTRKGDIRLYNLNKQES